MNAIVGTVDELNPQPQPQVNLLVVTVDALRVKRAVVLDFTTKADAAMEAMRGQCSVGGQTRKRDHDW